MEGSPEINKKIIFNKRRYEALGAKVDQVQNCKNVVYC